MCGKKHSSYVEKLVQKGTLPRVWEKEEITLKNGYAKGYTPTCVGKSDGICSLIRF